MHHIILSTTPSKPISFQAKKEVKSHCGPLNRWEIIPGTENLVSFLGLVKSWASEKNLALPLCKTSVTAYFILNLNLISTESYCPS